LERLTIQSDVVAAVVDVVVAAFVVINVKI